MFHPEFGLISNTSGNGTLTAIQSKLKEMPLQEKADSPRRLTAQNTMFRTYSQAVWDGTM